jgi:polyisoprenoid-binding protein YceI
MSNAPTTLDGLTPGTWCIDPSHTEVGFVARHAMVTKVRGYFRESRAPIVVADEFANSSRHRDHEGRLRRHRQRRPRRPPAQSADFFDAETYPGDDLRLQHPSSSTSSPSSAT